MILDWRVEKMKLSKDKTQIRYNDFLTLAGIPPEALDYRLGNRSALAWVIDQYQVKTDKRSGITNDPNRPSDPQYIVNLISKVITVSLETVKLVKGLPECPKRYPIKNGILCKYLFLWWTENEYEENMPRYKIIPIIQD